MTRVSFGIMSFASEDSKAGTGYALGAILHVTCADNGSRGDSHVTFQTLVERICLFDRKARS